MTFLFFFLTLFMVLLYLISGFIVFFFQKRVAPLQIRISEDPLKVDVKRVKSHEDLVVEKPEVQAEIPQTQAVQEPKQEV